MKELWKPIKGYNLYFVSTKGRVKSYNTNNSAKGNNRILKTIVRKSGYCVVNLFSYDKTNGSKGKLKQYRVHKLVAKAFIPNPENKPQINHIDGNKENNCVTNLEWCTHSENMRHAYDNGLTFQPKGIVTTKLNEDLVKEIRKRYKKEDVSHYKLSLDYDVSEATIRNVIVKNSWKYV